MGADASETNAPTRRVVIQRGCAEHVDWCPKPERVWKGKPYANVMHDCRHCKHLVEWGVVCKAYTASDPSLSPEQRIELLNEPEQHGYILCGLAGQAPLGTKARGGTYGQDGDGRPVTQEEPPGPAKCNCPRCGLLRELTQQLAGTWECPP